MDYQSVRKRAKKSLVYVAGLAGSAPSTVRLFEINAASVAEGPRAAILAVYETLAAGEASK